MRKITAIAYLKDGSTLPINYYNHFCGNLIDFSITIDGEEIDFLFDGSLQAKEKWKERDIEAEKRHHEDGYYKKARFNFDRIEIYEVIG